MNCCITAPDPITLKDAKKAFKKFAAVDGNGVKKTQCGIETVVLLKKAKRQQEAYRDNTYKLDKKRTKFERHIKKIDTWILNVYNACGVIPLPHLNKKELL